MPATNKGSPPQSFSLQAHPSPRSTAITATDAAGDEDAAKLEHYVEALGDTSASIVVVQPNAEASNDRIITLSGGEIFDQLIRRTDYAQHLQDSLQSMATCLESAKLPTPLAPQPVGSILLGSPPSLNTLNGPCTNPDRRDISGNWSELLRYGRCTDGSPCLASPDGTVQGRPVCLAGNVAAPPQFSSESARKTRK